MIKLIKRTENLYTSKDFVFTLMLEDNRHYGNRDDPYWVFREDGKNIEECMYLDVIMLNNHLIEEI